MPLTTQSPWGWDCPVLCRTEEHTQLPRVGSYNFPAFFRVSMAVSLLS